MQLTHVGRQSLVESVIARLRETIERGTWQVGERIPVEADLARDLGVSRNTVREAVRVLVHAGLMETRQGAGTFVRASRDPGETLRAIERTELHEQLEVRLTLEVEAARLAALRHDADDLAVMRDALLARAAAGGDIQARIRHDERFHLAVMQAAHNRALLTLYLYFAHAVIRTIERTEHDADLPEPSQADHEKLLDAIASGDAERAAQAARHLLQPSLNALTEN